MNATIPAHLWIGSNEATHAAITTFLQKKVCANNGCGHCISCTQINARQHHALLWIEPEKGYTLADLDDLFRIISFSLAQDEHFYFVLAKADQLNSACANSLLKSIEEPPHGYHFLLAAERKHLVLPTIRSRCIEHLVTAQANALKHEALYRFFLAYKSCDPLEFNKALEQSSITEQESIELLDNLITHWGECYKEALLNGEKNHAKKAHAFLRFLEKFVVLPPGPGSSKLFWRTVFLQHAYL